MGIKKWRELTKDEYMQIEYYWWWTLGILKPINSNSKGLYACLSTQLESNET